MVSLKLTNERCANNRQIMERWFRDVYSMYSMGLFADLSCKVHNYSQFKKMMKTKVFPSIKNNVIGATCSCNCWIGCFIGANVQQMCTK